MGRRRAVITTLLVFVIALSIGLAVIYSHADWVRKDRQRTVNLAGTALASSLQREVERATSSATVLSLMIRQDPGALTQEFDRHAQSILDSFPRVHALYVVPLDGSTLKYPATAHRLPEEFRRLDRRHWSPIAGEAFEAGRTTLVGPITVEEEKDILLAAAPVYLESADGSRMIWGMAMADIHVMPLLASLEMMHLSRYGLRYELSHRDVASDVRTAFAGSQGGPPLRKPLHFPVTVPRDVWWLSIAPEEGWIPQSLVVGDTIALTLVCLLLAAGFYSTYLRIAERRATARRVREHGRFLQHLIESLNHPFLVVNAQTMEVLLANSAATLLGVHAPVTCGNTEASGCEGCQDDEAGGRTCPIRSVRTRGESVTVERSLTLADGATRTFEVHVYPVFDEDGGVDQVIEYAFDISERKRHEKERETLIGELRQAIGDVKALTGLLPICASCKRIRDDQGYWSQVEAYITSRTEATFSHGICPDCVERLYPKYSRSARAAQIKEERREAREKADRAQREAPSKP